MTLPASFHATRRSFDALVTRLVESLTTLSERDLLAPTHWTLGEDARLREDMRFRESPWGRWMLAQDVVANDAIYRWLHAERRSAMALETALARATALFGRSCVFCVDDPRFVLRHDEVHLAASELSRHPVIEGGVGDSDKYMTHLPLHSLKAAAASEPAGQWGPTAQERAIETLGWVRVALPGRRLNDRMFIAAIEGHSMDDGKSGLVDGGYAVFELWPAGSKQNLSVLVRGAFSDPETGSYAVKKYVADQRDAEGRHNNVSLVSLNPNKERYPNIDLQPADDDEITVVAKVLHALSTDDYERRPKSMRRVGRRNLARDEQSKRLARRVASFFDGTAPEADDDGTSSASTGWQTRLVCLGVAAGGLQLEVGPLNGLPNFVKKLRVVGVEWDAIVLAANAKSRPMRVTVRPGTGPWRWEAVGFAEEHELGLDKLALDALEVSAPIVFRVDADGVGQRVMGKTLALGQSYRLLLPPNVEQDAGIELEDGWRVWSIDLGVQLSSTMRQTLTALGLSVGETCPRLEWALAQPSAWSTNALGENYPVFEASTELLVNVGGVAVDEGDEAVLFLHGASGTTRLPVAANGLVSLGAPAVGRWACALLHSRTSIHPATLFFEIAENAAQHIAATWTAAAPGELSSLEATAPPGWPVILYWRVIASHEALLATLYANDDCTLPVERIASLIEDRAVRARIADLVVDFGELGRRSIPQDGRATLKQVREQLTALWQQHSGLVQRRAGAWLQLMSPWFEPVTALLGYGLELSPLPADAEAPHDLAAWVLTVDERFMGSITRSPSRVLVLTTDIDAVLRDSRARIDAACTAAKVRDAIVTDGMRWTTHRKGSQQLKQQVWSLDYAIGLGSIDEMLGDLAEGL